VDQAAHGVRVDAVVAHVFPSVTRSSAIHRGVSRGQRLPLASKKCAALTPAPYTGGSIQQSWVCLRRKHTGAGRGRHVITCPQHRVPHPSGQGQEQLFQFCLGELWLLATFTRGVAVPHAARHDLEPGPVQGAGDRGQLLENGGAVLSFLDHRDDTGELPLSALEPREGIAHHFRLHLTPFEACPHHTPGCIPFAGNVPHTTAWGPTHVQGSTRFERKPSEKPLGCHTLYAGATGDNRRPPNARSPAVAH